MMIAMTFDTPEEKEKFTRLYEEFRKIIYFTVKRYMDNETDIEDYLQDIYIIIGENLNKIDENNSKKTQNYLITITRNYCISRWRRHKVQEQEFSDEIQFSDEDERSNPLNLIIKDETYALMKKALDKLDTKYRAALELKYFNELDYDSISKILNISKKNAQMRVFRAKSLVRSYIKELENEQ